MLQMVRIIGTRILASFPSSPGLPSCSARTRNAALSASTGSKDVQVGLGWIGAWAMRW